MTEHAPLVTVPILGECLVVHWLEHLSGQGVRDVEIIATDRPELVRAIVGDGQRWGMKVGVTAEMAEPTVEGARAKYLGDSEGLVILLDRLPGAAEGNLFASYSAWLKSAFDFIPQAVNGSRVGLRQVSPGVWVGLRTQISQAAILTGPCWIGESVRIGPEAVVGPNAIIEDQVVIEPASEIQDSWVGPATFVGSLTRIKDSLAWGNKLLNVRTNSNTLVPDAFLLSSLSQQNPSPAFSERIATIFQNSFMKPLGALTAFTQKGRR